MAKPPECSGCPLEDKNKTFAHHDGPVDAPLLVVAEALGKEEGIQSKHLVGPAGQFHWKQAKRAGFTREQVRVGNIISCQPPFDDLVGATWEYGAVRHCAVHREPLFEEDHQAILCLGATAMRTVCEYYGASVGTLDHSHGYVIGDGTHPWIIPTFHPARLLRGQFRYTGVYIHDLTKAWEVATKGFKRGHVDLVADPELGWFMKWASAVTEDTWLGVDIETPEQGNDPHDPSDPSWRVLYVNFSYNLDEGISVPFEGPYIPVIKGILERCRWQWYWNAHYDVKRLKRYGSRIPWYYDAKDGWHLLQSDMGADDKDDRDRSAKATILGNSLGFVAPYYSDLPPWKHYGALSGYYRCMDGVQTLRVAHGIARDLQSQGQWEIFLRHSNQFGHQFLRPAEAEGLRVDTPQLEAYGEVLKTRIDTLGQEIADEVPVEVLPLKKPYWKRPPAGYEGIRDADLPTDGSWRVVSTEKGVGAILGHLEVGLVKVCKGCGVRGVTAAHKTCGAPRIELEEELVPRWSTKLEFNGGSPDQIRTYLIHKGLNTGRNKKSRTDKMTTEAGALERIAEKDPIIRKVLDRREVAKLDGNYVAGVLGKRQPDGTRKGSRLDEGQRVHTTFLERPSTQRLSSIDPNIQNVVHGDEVDDDVVLPPWDASGFRKAIVAGDGCELWEFDYSAIEAVITGWFCGDPDYIRLAQAGVHAYLTAVGIGATVPRPEELKFWEPARLKKLLKPFKSHAQYPVKKRVVHGVSYGLTAFGMAKLYPDLFPTPRAAQKEIDFFFEVCPKVKEWQNRQRDTASRLGYLGGKGGAGEAPHPYRYKHWFFDVMHWDSRYKKWVVGADANRAVAFKPQSTARGVLTEAALELTDPKSDNYAGHLYYGRTPFRGVIHDSFLCEVPVENGPILQGLVTKVMTTPVKALPCPPEWGLGEFLEIGVAAKRGKNWGPKRPDNLEGMEAA